MSSQVGLGLIHPFARVGWKKEHVAVVIDWSEVVFYVPRYLCTCQVIIHHVMGFVKAVSAK